MRISDWSSDVCASDLDQPGATPALLGLAYTVLIGTIAGSGVWSWLMSRHPAGVVAPFSMLVPVVGMSAAWLMLGETTSPGELVGAVLVVGGVLLGSRLPTPQAETPPAEVSRPRSPRSRDRQVPGLRCDRRRQRLNSSY